MDHLHYKIAQRVLWNPNWLTRPLLLLLLLLTEWPMPRTHITTMDLLYVHHSHRMGFLQVLLCRCNKISPQLTCNGSAVEDDDGDDDIIVICHVPVSPPVHVVGPETCWSQGTREGGEHVRKRRPPPHIKVRRITGALWAINKLSDLAVFIIFLGSFLVERCEFVLYNERSKKRSDNISKIFSSTQELFMSLREMLLQWRNRASIIRS